MAERLIVQSRSPFEIHHILTGLEDTPETEVEVDLFLPEGEGPFGCVIALHGRLGRPSSRSRHRLAQNRPCGLQGAFVHFTID